MQSQGANCFVKGKAQYKIQELSLQPVSGLDYLGFSWQKKNNWIQRSSPWSAPTSLLTSSPSGSSSPFTYASHPDFPPFPTKPGMFWLQEFHTCKCLLHSKVFPWPILQSKLSSTSFSTSPLSVSSQYLLRPRSTVFLYLLASFSTPSTIHHQNRDQQIQWLCFISLLWPQMSSLQAPGGEGTQIILSRTLGKSSFQST